MAGLTHRIIHVMNIALLLTCIQPSQASAQSSEEQIDDLMIGLAKSAQNKLGRAVCLRRAIEGLPNNGPQWLFKMASESVHNKNDLRKYKPLKYKKFTWSTHRQIIQWSGNNDTNESCADLNIMSAKSPAINKNYAYIYFNVASRCNVDHYISFFNYIDNKKWILNRIDSIASSESDLCPPLFKPQHDISSLIYVGHVE